MAHPASSRARSAEAAQPPPQQGRRPGRPGSTVPTGEGRAPSPTPATSEGTSDPAASPRVRSGARTDRRGAASRPGATGSARAVGSSPRERSGRSRCARAVTVAIPDATAPSTRRGVAAAGDAGRDAHAVKAAPASGHAGQPGRRDPRSTATRSGWPTAYWGNASGPAGHDHLGRSRPQIRAWGRGRRGHARRARRRTCCAGRSSPNRPVEARRRTSPGRWSSGHFELSHVHAVIRRPALGRDEEAGAVQGAPDARRRASAG